MDPQYLEKIGFTKNESKVYLTLLKIGLNKTGEILKKSNLNSGKIYEILESLKNKGLISETIKNGVKHFAAAPPSQLLQYLELKKNQLKNEELTIKEIIPKLEKIREETLPKKIITTYTGFKGIITASEEALAQISEDEEILSLGISDINTRFQKYWLNWEKKRLKKKIKSRYILSQKGSIFNDLKKVKNVEVKVLLANTPVGIDIYGKSILILLHYQEPISCTIIYDEHTIKTFKSYFEILWKQAK